MNKIDRNNRYGLFIAIHESIKTQNDFLDSPDPPCATLWILVASDKLVDENFLVFASNAFVFRNVNEQFEAEIGVSNVAVRK